VVKYYLLNNEKTRPQSGLEMFSIVWVQDFSCECIKNLAPLSRPSPDKRKTEDKY